MADEEKDVEVQVDAPPVEGPEVEAVVETPAAPAAKTVTADEGIEALKRKMEEANARAEAEATKRAAAEREAAEANARMKGSYIAAKNAEYGQVTGAISNIEGALASLEKEYAEAAAIGDAEKMGKLARDMARANVNLETLEIAKQRMVAEAERMRREPPPEAPRAAPTSVKETVQRLAEGTTPRSAAWLRDNADKFTSEAQINKMARAHLDALDDGIQVESPEYFALVENRLGFRAPAPRQEEDGEVMSSASRVRETAPPVAPPSRGQNGRDIVRLTSEEADMAKMMGMTPKEYAISKRELQAQGKIGR